MRDRFDRTLRFVTEHNRIVVLLMLVLSVGVVMGVGNLKMESDASSSATLDTTIADKQDYIATNYANGSQQGQSLEPAVVYVRDRNGNVLSKGALLESLRYQKQVRTNASVAAALGDRGRVLGVSNLVAMRLAGTRDASLSEQIAALEGASPRQVRRAVKATLTEGSPALRLLPRDYRPGSAAATSRRLVFQFATEDTRARDDTYSKATKALYDAASEYEQPEYFTFGEHAHAAGNQQYMQNTMELVVPVALALILVVLAFAYRDLVDVLVGFFGVVLSVLWMFGILGWMGIPAGITLIIGPVLIVGLSVDYGLHVFMRYREQRGEGEGIAEPMHRGLRSVAVALALVTVTTAVGFLANLTSDWTVVRQLSVGITLGVVSGLLIFVTVVPALKVSIDGLLERVGLDRRKQPLGKTRFIEPFLASGARAARRAAPLVLAIALVAGAAGAVAWTDLDRQSYQADEDGIAEWKQNLPGFLAWDVHEVWKHGEFISEHYRAADADSQRDGQLLVEGAVTHAKTLERLQVARESIVASDIVFDRNGKVDILGPVAVMQQVAATNDEFASVFERADTDGNGVPDRNLRTVYDALYAAAPDQARRVVERTDGEYRSVRLVVPLRQGANYETANDVLRGAAASVESADGALTATPVSRATLSNAVSTKTANNILQTLLVALGAVAVVLTLVYRVAEGSATLGAVTAVPVVLVTTTVVGGMWVFDIPLTFLTALLMSLVVGLGIDYSIHVSDRFAQELNAGLPSHNALYEAVTGTGGALLGSSLTSVAAFSALLLHPHPQLQSFGTLVFLALSTSFVVSVFVLPSVLHLWAERFHEAPAESADAMGGSPASQD